MGKKESEQLLKSDLCSFQKIKLCIYSLFGIMVLSLTLLACANKGVIDGGEKDTIPPTLINTIPFNQSLDYSGTEIVLTFDERVQATQLQRKLLITPFTDTRYKVKINKNIVQLSFEESFTDSTTFTLNFSDAITDVTENNPAKNVIVAFSTWHIIDSLSIFGKIVDLMSNQPVEAAAVSVYEAEDTLDIFSGKPYYFAITDEFGRFTIQNMKGGKYRLYAFKDENSNYLNEPSSESHGFIRDTLEIESQTDSIFVHLILQDVQELKFVNTRSNGNHFDVRYNKYVESYSFQPMDSTADLFPSILTSENLVVRFYKNQIVKDSVGYYLTVNDSVGNSSTDTIYLKFTDRKLNLSKLEIEHSPTNGADINESLQLKLEFNKPIQSFNYDNLLIKYDTSKSDRIDSIGDLVWNWNKTRLTITAQLEKNYLADELKRLKILKDSLTRLDSIRGIRADTTMNKVKQRKIDPNKIQFYSGYGSFLSIENDSSEIIRSTYTFKNSEKFGKISGEISIDSTYFIVQLINNSYEVVNELYNQKKYQFDFVPPGKYNIRVLVDLDDNSQWSYGNIKHGITPERIVFHPTFVELRENWEINNINLVIDP